MRKVGESELVWDLVEREVKYLLKEEGKFDKFLRSERKMATGITSGI